MVIGLDFDGVICREYKWPWFLRPFRKWLLVFLLFLPEKPGLEIARRLSRDHRIIVITARPRCYAWLSRLWLTIHGLRVHALYCVGEQDKTKALLGEGVEVFFDNELVHVEKALAQGVRAFLFSGWDQAGIFLGSVGE